MITQLQPNEIFVFGSNTAGRHGRGAALQAKDQFGAVYGVGEGLTGQCYAFPTLDGSHNQLRPLNTHSLRESRNKLYTCCDANPDKIFLLTKVGCGLAGYDEDYMRSFFITNPPDNLVLPEDWRPE